MNEMKYCQSCGMPMGQTNELYGINRDGSKSEEYCMYCFKEGEFLGEMSMEEMIEFCIPHMVEHNPNMTPRVAREMMQKFFPTLKRWQHK